MSDVSGVGVYISVDSKLGKLESNKPGGRESLEHSGAKEWTGSGSSC